MQRILIVLMSLFMVETSGFRVQTRNRHFVRRESELSMTMSVSHLADSSLTLAELFSGPAAKYNGELVMPGLKQVTVAKAELPAGTRYGDVSAEGYPVLGSGLLLVVLLAAAVPYFLSIGESAQAQQRVREESDKTNPYNSFVNKSRTSTGVVVGAKKTSPKSAPAAKASSPFSLNFGSSKSAPTKPAAAPVKPAPAAKATSPFSLNFGSSKKSK